MPTTRITNNSLAANAALNNLNAGANITFTKQVIIHSLGGAAFGTGVTTALAATANTGGGLVTANGTSTLTNKTIDGASNTITNVSITSGVSGLGSGVAAFLNSPTSDNLRAAVTGETGTDALVFNNGPTLIAPNIGAATGTSLALSGNLTVDSSTLVVDSVNDRIGIGTTNPQSGFRLDVNGWAVIRGDHYVNGNLIEFGTSAYRLHKTAANWINGGNLGIGTTTPNERLTVSGNLSASGDAFASGSKLSTETFAIAMAIAIG